jgi:hypothetical protein
MHWPIIGRWPTNDFYIDILLTVLYCPLRQQRKLLDAHRDERTADGSAVGSFSADVSADMDGPRTRMETGLQTVCGRKPGDSRVQGV